MEETRKKERLYWLDYAKGIAIYLVVIGHCETSTELHNWIYSFHMGLFFMLSGMTFRPQKYASLSEITWDKVKKRLLPYLTICFFNIIPWIVNYKILDTENKDNLLTILFGIVYSNWDAVTMVNNVVWFLPALMCVEILAWLMVKLQGDSKSGLLNTALVFLALNYGDYLYQNGEEISLALPWHLNSVFGNTCYFLIGYLVMRHWNVKGWYQRRIVSIRERKPGHKWKTYTGYAVMLATLVAASIISVMAIGKISFASGHYKSMFGFLTASISMIVVILVFSMLTERIRILSVPFSYLGKNTLWVLCIHKPVIYITESLWHVNNISEHIVLYIITMVVFMFPLIALGNRFAPFVVGKSINNKAPRWVSYLLIGIYSVAAAIMMVKYLVL